MEVSPLKKKNETKEHREERLRKRRERDQKRRLLKPSPGRDPVTPTPAERTFSEDEVRVMLRKALTMRDEEKEEPVRLTRAERRMERRKARLQAELDKLDFSKEPPEEAKYPLSVEQAEAIEKKESHFKGKKPIQFAKPNERIDQSKPKKRLRFRLHRGEPKEIADMAEDVTSKKNIDIPDVVEEQIGKPMTTTHCPESVKEDGLPDVKANPEQYLEVNMILKSRVVDSFFILIEKKRFHYKTLEYKVDEDSIYLFPKKKFFVPTCFYREGQTTPQGFKNLNKGITGKALSLLYLPQLYVSLLYAEDERYNLFIVIMSAALLISFIAGLYLLLFYNGGIFQPPIPLPNIGGNLNG